MLAASVGIVPVGVAVWWLGGGPALPPEGVALGLASGVVEAAYFIFLAGGLPARRPVGRLPARARDGAAARGRSSASVCSASGWGSPGRSAWSRCWPGSCGCSDRGERSRWRAAGAARARAKAAADSAILFALATGVMIATYTAIDRVGTRLIDPFPYAAILWVTCSVVLVGWVALVAGGDLLRYGPDGGAAGGRRRLADAGGLPVHPRRAERGAAVRCRAAARVGDGLRRGLGLGPDGRGDRPGARRSGGSGRRC